MPGGLLALLIPLLIATAVWSYLYFVGGLLSRKAYAGLMLGSFLLASTWYILRWSAAKPEPLKERLVVAPISGSTTAATALLPDWLTETIRIGGGTELIASDAGSFAAYLRANRLLSAPPETLVARARLVGFSHVVVGKASGGQVRWTIYETDGGSVEAERTAPTPADPSPATAEKTTAAVADLAVWIARTVTGDDELHLRAAPTVVGRWAVAGRDPLVLRRLVGLRPETWGRGLAGLDSLALVRFTDSARVALGRDSSVALSWQLVGRSFLVRALAVGLEKRDSTARRALTKIALGTLTRAIQLDRSDGTTLTALGNVHLMLRRFNDADALFREALARDRYADEPWLGLAHLDPSRWRTISLPTREALYRRVIYLNPCNYGALVQLAGWYGTGDGARLRDTEESDPRRALEQAIRLDPRAPGAWAELIDLDLRHDRFEPAEANAQTLIRLAPTRSDGLFRLGVAQFRQDRLDEAKATFERAIAIDRDRESYLYLGQIDEQLADKATAAGDTARARTLRAEAVRSYITRIERRTGETDRYAATAYKQLRTLSPMDWFAVSKRLPPTVIDERR